MTKPELKAFVKANLGPLLKQVGLDYWEVSVGYERLDAHDGDEVAGECSTSFEYERARINLNPDCFEDCTEGYVLEVLRHEICHILHSPFLMVMDMARAVMSDAEYALLLVGWHRAQELTVCSLERAWRNLRPEWKAESLAESKEPPKDDAQNG